MLLLLRVIYPSKKVNTLYQGIVYNNIALAKWAKARAGKNSFPPTPFLFARPSGPVLSCAPPVAAH